MFLALSADMISIPLLVWSLYAGLAIGLVLGYYMKRILGSAVRKLIETGSIGIENAKTLAELGITKPNIIRSIKKGALSKYIKSTLGNRTDLSEGANPSSAASAPGASAETGLAGQEERFYIEEKDRIQAELRYTKSGNDLFPVIISLIVFLMIAFLAARYLPMLLDIIGGIFS